MNRLIVALVAALFALTAAPALADPPEQDWICHATGSDSNPFVLLHVPTNSAHFTKHLPDGTDKAPALVDPAGDPYPPNLTCGDPGSDPTPPFTGKLTFTLDEPQCAPGQAGVPGFTVTQAGRVFQIESIVDGVIEEAEIFVFPPTCIPGMSIVTTLTTQTSVPVKKCRSRRAFTIHLPKRFAGVRRVRAKIGGQAKSIRVGTGRTVRISFVGRKPGIYAVVLRAQGKRLDRLYALCGNGNVEGYNVP